jgi:hypothetical protein
MDFLRSSTLIALLLAGQCASGAETNVPELVAAIKQVDKRGVGHRPAVVAVQKLQQADATSLPAILGGMDDAGPLAVNWLRGAFEAIAEREQQAGRDLNQNALEGFVADRKHGDHARRLAYEWLTRLDGTTPGRLLPTMLDDPSLELRYDAIEQKLVALDTEHKKGQPPKKLAAQYRAVLTSARDLDQIKTIAERLKALGEQVNLVDHFGFVRQWQLVGPFDNTGGRGYSAVYEPEKTVDFHRSYPGKTDTVEWKGFTTKDEYGLVDLNQALGKQMGAVAYAAAVFQSDRQQEVDVRLGCINACKVWLNGQLLIEREIYHTGMEIDQYVGRGKLQPGPNMILVKVCQNEQTEDWAQNWQFQLRVCDARGTAVLSLNREAASSNSEAGR